MHVRREGASIATRSTTTAKAKMAGRDSQPGSPISVQIHTLHTLEDESAELTEK
jgi:hypothetical protein